MSEWGPGPIHDSPRVKAETDGELERARRSCFVEMEGGYLLTFWDAANPDVLYCITAGEIGFLETESQHEYFKYSVTRVRSGEVGTTPNSQPATCDGEEFAVDLFGCVQRD